MGVWLHDIGHYPISEMDHAVIGEKRSREFLTSLKISPAKKDAICHCVRAHRCKDIMPQTIEAKIVACADSASHFTDFAYLDSIMKNKDNKKSYSITEKIERDYRDIALFPEVKRELEILYKKWKELVVEFKRVNDKV